MAAEPKLQGAQYPLFDNSYELVRIVGRGRNSIVYEARKFSSESPYPYRLRSTLALKILSGAGRKPEINLQRMKHEALCMLAARHPNVIKLYDYVSTGDVCYLAMEYAERGDLLNLLGEQDVLLEPATALRIIRQVLCGLENVHRVGIVHRDIKPENLLLTWDGILKIIDFGIAFSRDKNVSADEANRGIGTFEYLSPECLEDGVTDVSMDLYATAVTCYQLLTKNMPFAGTSFSENIENKMAGRLLPLAVFLKQAPPLLDELLVKALSTDPGRRFRSAAEFGDAIDKYLVGEWHPDPLPRRENALPAPGVDNRPQTQPEHTAPLRSNELVEIKERSLDLPRARTSEHQQRAARPQPRRPRSSGPVLLLFLLVLLLGGLLLFNFLQSGGKGDLPRHLAALGRRVSLLMSELRGVSSEHEGVTAVPASRVSNSLPPTAFFMAGRRVGLLHLLLSDESDVSFSVTVGEAADHAVMTLGFPGWISAPLDIRALDAGEHVRIVSGPVDITLWIDPASDREVELKGFYRENKSGRQGTWVLW